MTNVLVSISGCIILYIFQIFVQIPVNMAFSLNLNRTFCSFDCSCNAMPFRDKLDHINYSYDSISCLRPATFRHSGVLFKFPYWVKQNKDSSQPERLEETAFKISSILWENLMRHLFCFDYDDTKTIDYHYDELVWTGNYLINNYYYPPNFGEARVPKLGQRVPRRIPRMVSLYYDRSL